MGVSSSGKTPAFEADFRWFESNHAYHLPEEAARKGESPGSCRSPTSALVAQWQSTSLVRKRPPGSIPAKGSTFACAYLSYKSLGALGTREFYGTDKGSGQAASRGRIPMPDRRRRIVMLWGCGIKGLPLLCKQMIAVRFRSAPPPWTGSSKVRARGLYPRCFWFKPRPVYLIFTDWQEGNLNRRREAPGLHGSPCQSTFAQWLNW